ncbi:hypothetical protein AYL99_08046 [Fonsecaea erecta]|uniref:C2H2-type domain-containing protein n=1 Tax=Fonsecaea erecta TaxID=1367422 RepID=A0A178ZC21_9EURO|nr:hypothetical protein AYL99_08046 [Fonsecaea erecta]OAP57308.1 hypothetical protein AYL99_08046 [Fonsecaea erecta]
MDMFGAPFVNYEFPSFDPAFLSPELSGNVPAYFDPSCAGSSSIDSSETLTTPFHLSIPGREPYAAAAFGIDDNEVGDLWASNCHESGTFSQSWQACYESIEGTIFQAALTPSDISHTASNFEAWSLIGPSASYFSQASPPALQDETGGNNLSTIKSGFPVQSDDQPDREPEPTPPNPPKVKRKRVKGPVVCPTCSKAFDKPYLLQGHMREHGDRYRCPRCQQTFAQAANIAMHIKKHDAGPYVCQTCTKEFVKPACYRNHIKCHNGDRQKKKCPKEGCEKTYTLAGALNRHIRSHYEDYKCSDCGKLFGRSDLRARHQAKHCANARARRQAEDSLVMGLPPAQPQLCQIHHQADEPVHAPVQLSTSTALDHESLPRHHRLGLGVEHHQSSVAASTPLSNLAATSLCAINGRLIEHLTLDHELRNLASRSRHDLLNGQPR